MKVLFIFLTLLFSTVSLSEETAGLGENLDDCPKGCECITDTARGKTDKSGVVRVDETVPEPKEGETIGK